MLATTHVISHKQRIQGDRPFHHLPAFLCLYGFLRQLSHRHIPAGNRAKPLFCQSDSFFPRYISGNGKYSIIRCIKAVEEQELEKVKNKFESTQIFGNINYLNVATNLAWFELAGQAEDIDREVERYRAVTAEQLKAVAQETFREENSVVLYYEKDK